MTKEEAEQWAEEHGMEYIETSAKTGQGIEEAFEKTALRIHQRLLLNKEKLARKRNKKRGSFPSLQSGASKAGGCC